VVFSIAEALQQLETREEAAPEGFFKRLRGALRA
jgi:hypothetical protein